VSSTQADGNFCICFELTTYNRVGWALGGDRADTRGSQRPFQDLKVVVNEKLNVSSIQSAVL